MAFTLSLKDFLCHLEMPTIEDSYAWFLVTREHLSNMEDREVEIHVLHQGGVWFCLVENERYTKKQFFEDPTLQDLYQFATEGLYSK